MSEGTVVLRSPREVAALREAGRIVAGAFQHVELHMVPGVSTLELDRRAEAFIRECGARPMYKGYAPPGHTPFPATICVAVNHQIVHGIPAAGQILQEGDIIGIDIGAEYGGWISDACRTYAVGRVSKQARKLVDTARECLELGIGQARPGNRLGDIGQAIQRHAERQGFSVVRELTGHGVGRALWEPPSVFHWGRAGTGYQIRPGMVFTIEPMINAGAPHIRLEQDGWTIVTADGSLSAQFEDSLAITERGADVLTAL